MKLDFWIFVIIIIFLIFIAGSQLKQEIWRAPNHRQADGNGELYYLGRGRSTETTAQLLNRIEWSCGLENRIGWVCRYLIISIIILLMLIFALYQKIPSVRDMIIILLMVFVVLYASHQFLYVHGDNFNQYYIGENVRLIRQQLNLEANQPENPSDDNIPDRTKTTSI